MSTAGPSSRAEDMRSSSHPQSRPGVMTRLHGLFEHHSDVPDSPKTDTWRSAQRRKKSRPPPPFIKVRMVTWNMHDSLPKGDLEELLGAVHSDSTVSTAPGSLPQFPMNAEHPFHLLVVAGQECPTLSGLPMGLGAGFKLKDKDRDKSKDKEKEKEDEAEKSLLDDRDEEKEDNPKRRSRSHHRSIRLHSHRHSHEEASSTPGSSEHGNQSHHAYGWTSMLEDWYVHGGCNAEHSTSTPHTSSQDGHPSAGFLDSSDVPMSPKARSTGDLNSRMNTHRQGPYELLVKERMMGLYLAVFIHRDIRDLVQGTSRSAVTAGLIGGRVGNKGGVGISINLNGTTMLFINAHLAAHEGKVHHRIANYNKIKSELTVDDFLAPDDPRVMEEDVTDRFDFAFLCGDLNFRLDITRLHADWLISRREYEQALAFDQLRRCMQNGEAFVGFNEAPIDFAPTFKYDVLRYKRSKHKSMKRSSKQPEAEQTAHVKLLTEIEEAPAAGALDEDRSEGEQEYDGEAMSLASTAWTSRYTLANEDDERDDYFQGSTSPRLSTSMNNILNKSAATAAVHKAKTKWMSLISSSASSSPSTPLFKRLKNKHNQESKYNWQPDSPPPSLPSPPLTPSLSNSPPPEFRAMTFPPTPAQDELNGHDRPDDKYLMPPRTMDTNKVPPPMSRALSSKSTERVDLQEDEEAEKGVYDTSHKKRVPSWCDRILWKTSRKPGAEPEEEEEEEEEKELPPPPLPPRTRMGSLFHAFARSRKGSEISLDVSPTLMTPEQQHTSPDARTGEDSPVFSFDATPPRPDFYGKLRHSASADHIAIAAQQERERPHSQRTKTHLPLLEYRRTRQVSLHSLQSNRGPPSPAIRVDSPLHSEIAPPVPPKDSLPSLPPVSSLWKSFNFLPFLRDASQHSTNPERPPTPETPPPPQPKKGDVVCLAYNTLDDRQMRRLEGKSDHRPVIGAYALYI